MIRKQLDCVFGNMYKYVLCLKNGLKKKNIGINEEIDLCRNFNYVGCIFYSF